MTDEVVDNAIATGTRRGELRLLAVLATLMAFASISTDLYLPALPRMSVALGASQSTLELTIAGYLIGFSIGQLLWGPIGDRFGRRGPVAIGLVVFVLGSAGCALSTSAGQLIGWRVVQALGACASVVLARAMVRDLYDRDKGARILSTLMTVMAVAPLVGPSLGGQILQIASWQAISWTLVGIGVVTLAALFTVPETLPPARRNREPLASAFAAYASLIGNRQLLGYAGAIGFFYSGIFAYVAGSPFAYIGFHHLSPQLYGVLFALGTVGLMAANLINSRLVARLGSDRLLLIGTIGAALAGGVVALVSGTGWGGLAGLATALCLYVAMNGFIIANAISGALAGFPMRAGAVSALLGAIQYGSGVIGSATAGAFADGTPWPMGWVIALSGIGSLVSLLVAGGKWRPVPVRV
jgi:DHA1 family bicyclomycin/chloramphenicol resistance-like MFS transporter